MDLKLNTLAIKKLKSDFGIDLMAGFELNPEDPDAINAFVVSCSQHLPKPPTLKQVEKDYDFLESVEAVALLFESLPGKQATPRKTARKKTSRKH